MRHPGRTVAFASETVAPRELQFPEQFRTRLATAVDVRLIRHGQTQGYVTDGGLTALGHWQSHRKGQDLAKGLKEGDTVRIVHAPTARATETAESLRSGVEQALGRYGIGGVTVEGPEPNDDFRNFQFWRDGVEMDVTAAFQDMALLREEHERRSTGDRPGWMVELDRFYKIQAAGGDPITSWLSTADALHGTAGDRRAASVARHRRRVNKGPANPSCTCAGTPARSAPSRRAPSVTIRVSRRTSKTCASRSTPTESTRCSPTAAAASRSSCRRCARRRGSPRG